MRSLWENENRPSPLPARAPVNVKFDAELTRVGVKPGLLLRGPKAITHVAVQTDYDCGAK